MLCYYSQAEALKKYHDCNYEVYVEFENGQIMLLRTDEPKRINHEEIASFLDIKKNMIRFVDVNKLY